jgi:hypothetical protein
MKAEMQTLELGNEAYALKMLASNKEENYTVEAYLLKEVFYNRTMYYADAIQSNIHRLSSKFFKCEQQNKIPSHVKFNNAPQVSLLPQQSDVDNNM